MKPVWKILGVCALVVLAAFGGWRWWQNAVIVVHPHVGPAVQAVYTTGNVEAVETVAVAPKAGGKLVRLLVDEGQDVKEGTLLAELDASDSKAAVAELKAKEAYAQAALKRSERLWAVQAVSLDAYQAAKATALAATAARKQAEAVVNNTQLVAPMDGRVIQRDGEVGTFVPAGQAVFWMANGPLRVTAQVDEEDIPRVRPGLPVLIRADALPGKTISTTVTSITPRGDATGRSFRVRVGLPEDTGLQIGMTTELNIVLNQTDDALLVPTSALSKGSVWVVTDGRLHKQPVTFGATGVSETQIVAGVGKNALVVLKPTAALKEGSRVHIRVGGREAAKGE